MKKLTARILCLLLCLSLLAVPALAEDAPMPVEEGIAPISIQADWIRSKGELVVHEADGLTDYVRREKTDTFYTAQGGTEITVSNIGAEHYAFIYIYFIRYTRQTDATPVTVAVENSRGELVETTEDLRGKYLGSGIRCLTDRPGADDDTLPAGQGLYWAATDAVDPLAMRNTGKVLYEGDSVTFTLPDDGTDAVYQLCAEIYYPLYDYFYWRTEYVQMDGAAPSAVYPFTDVFITDYFAEAVTWAVGREITNGTTPTTFSPERKCTTGHILTFLWRAGGAPEPTIENPFTDVDSDRFYSKAAIWAYEQGLVEGDAFGGKDPCTRGEAVTYLWKLAGSPEAGDSGFSDVPPGADYADAVAWAVERGITEGTSDTTFGPDDTCTRGQISTFLYREMA